MRRIPRALPLLLAALVLLSPVATAAEPILPGVLNDKAVEVGEALHKANNTYGERTEFVQAQISLSQSHIALLNDARVVSQSELIKAKSGLETGKARAQSGGSDQQVIDHGRQLASQAQAELRQIRGSLESMERTGLEPVAFEGGLTVAYAAHRTLDLLEQHRRALEQWEQGTKQDQVVTAIVSTGAGARMAAAIASDTLAKTTEARAEASPSDLLSPEELENLTKDRVAWTEANEAGLAKISHDRVLQMDEQDEQLMTLSAFVTYFQDVAFNGIRSQQAKGEDIDAYEVAEELYNNESARVEAWTEELDVPGDMTIGATESANFSLRLNQNKTGESRQRVGAFSLGLAHLGVEHAGLLQQAYGGEGHSPGEALVSPHAEDEGTIPSAGALIALTVLAVMAVQVGRNRR